MGAHDHLSHGAGAAQAGGRDEALAGGARAVVRPSPLLGGRRGAAWRFQVLECPLDDLKAAARAAGGSLNDAYVAALLGGLRIYHERHGVDVEELPMAMPISLRKADDPMGGNKFAGAYFAVPVGVADPAERNAILRGIVLTLRTEPALDTLSLATPVLNRIPSVVGSMLFDVVGSAADLSASNVPGVPYPVYMAGAPGGAGLPVRSAPRGRRDAAMISHGDHLLLRAQHRRGRGPGPGSGN